MELSCIAWESIITMQRRSHHYSLCRVRRDRPSRIFSQHSHSAGVSSPVVHPILKGKKENKNPKPKTASILSRFAKTHQSGKPFLFPTVERFGECVCNHIFGSEILQINLCVVGQFTNEVKPYIDVLGSRVMLRVLCKCNTPLIVDINLGDGLIACGPRAVSVE